MTEACEAPRWFGNPLAVQLVTGPHELCLYNETGIVEPARKEIA